MNNLMTDTTDIKALRDRSVSEVIANKGLISAELAMILISQLEAERQRAEDMTVSRDAMTDKRDTALAKVYELEAEILKLKGEQVPVGLVDERQGCGGICLTQHGRSLNIPHGTELFTAPQKPIVLPAHEDCQSCDRHYVDGMRAGWNFHEEGDNQGFIDSIERVQKDMREARNGRVKNDA